MSTLRLSLLIALTVALTVRSAQASDEFDASAATCIPDPASIQANNYLITGGTVKFSGSATGTITLYCPITHDLLTDATHMYLLYKDPTPSASTYVTATFEAMDMASGGTIDIKTVSSQDGTQDSSVHYVDELVSTPNWFFDASVYYIRVTMHRPLSGLDVIFYGVAVY